MLLHRAKITDERGAHVTRNLQGILILLITPRAIQRDAELTLTLVTSRDIDEVSG
jgi:hypothetical protein